MGGVDVGVKWMLMVKGCYEGEVSWNEAGIMGYEIMWVLWCKVG